MMVLVSIIDICDSFHQKILKYFYKKFEKKLSMKYSYAFVFRYEYILSFKGFDRKISSLKVAIGQKFYVDFFCLRNSHA